MAGDRLAIDEMRRALDGWPECHAEHGLVSPRCEDDEGRPLAEGKVKVRGPRAAPLTLRTCPYDGSRFNHKRPMNVSALRQINDHWTEVVAAAADLRELHVARYKTPELRSTDLYWIGSTPERGVAAPRRSWGSRSARAQSDAHQRRYIAP